ncbi:MAG TPA: excinuclease ABC subunit UvrA [Verrucomicrobiae bacterium]|nr:excinuclease ABC subunit UvrA [Verrucomicrobiae bacterium]
MAKDTIIIAGAREHNLKNIHLNLPREKLIVVTGLSGSGKSSLAFDTIYAEGQRKYVESLSAYARQFLEQLQKPDVDYIEGLSPAIAIEQRFAGSNPRSTIATTTETYEYLRLLFANIGKPHCYRCGRPITTQTTSQIVDQILAWGDGTQLMLLAPLVRGRKGEFRDVFARIKREGFVRARVDGEIVDAGEPAKLDKRRNHNVELVVDRLTASARTRARLADSVETTLKWGSGVMLVLYRTATTAVTAPWSERLFSSQNACPECGISYGEFTPRHFSFNSPDGACRTCHGLGTKLFFDPDLVVPDHSKSVANGAIVAWRRGGRRLLIYYKMLLRGLAKHYGVDFEVPFKDLPEKVQKELLHGSGDEEIEFTYWRKGAWRKMTKAFEGVVPNLERLYEETDSEFTKTRLQQFMVAMQCPDCKGARLRPESLAVTVGGKSIIDVTRMSIGDALTFLGSLVLSEFEETVAGEIIKEMRSRLTFLQNVGLSYLTLDRQSDTLSGGEAQRIRLATQVGAGLVGVLYVLDEPSIGLHQRDNHRLLETLKGLRDLGNTVIVVEHDEDTIRAADYVVDLGPGAGLHGGYVVAAGTLQAILESPKSLTGRYLRGELQIPVPKTRRAAKRGWLTVRGASENNLKKIDARFPLGLLTCVTGVSGSGKSTLVDDILRKALFRKFYRAKDRPGAHEAIVGLEELDKVIVIDQSPIGRTPRSNPATYTGAFNHIRTLFAQLPNARVRGYGPGRFSFNVKGGRCETCQGDGIIKIEMHFLPDVYVTCEQCGGKRYSRETLEITYKGRNIADVLDMTVDEAEEFFRAVPKIRDVLQTLQEVGLGYLKIGQQATTLSGGEAQRVKLSTELAKKATGRTLYILDEPTTGLHFADIAKLLEVLNKLRDAGNTVLVIEHNLDVIKSADWILDLGPEGGEAGGRIVAEGTPEQVAANARSYTGEFLKKMLSQRLLAIGST